MTFPPRGWLGSLSRMGLASLTVVVAVILPPAGRAGAHQPGDDLAAIRRQLAEATRKATGVLDQLRALDVRIYQVGQSIAADEREAARLESRIRSAQRKTRELEDRLQAARTSSNARARRIYKSGPDTFLAGLLSVRTFAELPRVSRFWEILAEQDGRIILRSSRLKAELADQKADLAGSVQALRARTERLDGLRERLRSSREDRAGTLERLRPAIESALAAERAILAARAAPVRAEGGPCPSGGARQAEADRKLAALLDWYAPAAGTEPFMPPRLSPTGILSTGAASWYGPRFDGCRASSGATFRANQMTAASLSLPFGTLVKVTLGSRSAVVVITDRGPYVEGRVLDLSAAAAEAVGLSGVREIRMEILVPSEPAPPFP